MPPASMVAGATICTCGGVVSGAATTTTEAVASAKLSLKSDARTLKPSDEPTTASAGIVKDDWSGSSESGSSVELSCLNVSAFTPTLSLVAADRRIVVPGAACGGALRLTTGGVVSGTAATLKIASAVPVLPAASRAIA